jgi:hypothetical protein
MRKTILAAFLAALLGPAAAHAQDGKLLAYWVQFNATGAAEARAVIDGPSCPAIEFASGAIVPMTVRAAADADFKLVCSEVIPAGTTQARIERGALTAPDAIAASVTTDPAGGKHPMHAGWLLPIPVADPQHILVIGDTGCRIKPPVVQNCADITQWAFPAVAASAAKMKPDLVIHVGDYLYREAACPAGNTACTGSPWGDNWAAWDADFFTPGQPLLAVTPWVIVRGNHEDCPRSGPGFLRLLGPGPFDPAAACSPHLPPYAVKAGSENLVVFDDASAPDTDKDAATVADYAKDFAALATVAPKPIWLMMHRPIWAAVTGPLGIPVGGNETMIAAAGDASSLAPVTLMLAGHIHTFEAINYKDRVPPQIVSGRGGANLDPTPASLKGTIFQGHSGVRVKDGISIGGFGTMMMNKNADAWDIDLYDANGAPDGKCTFAAGRVDCAKGTK